MRFLLVLCASLSFFPRFVFAEEEFSPESWSTGLHLFAGGGINTALYASDSEHLSMGIGANVKTDIGYYLSDNWAVELGSSVNFNKLRDNLVWNTFFTAGFRYRFGRLPFLPFSNNMYGRIFYGWAPTVVFHEEEIESSSGDEEEKTTRIHFHGPVYGLSLGNFMRIGGDWIYFIEFTGSAQHLDQEEKVKMEGQVPEVVKSDRVRDQSMIYSIHLNFGVLLF